MKNVLKAALFTALTAFLLSSCSSEQKEFRPESSSLFEERIDPESGVVSYSLKCGYPDDNRQSLYFVTKSMTEDGRFLAFRHTDGNEQKGAGPLHLMLADLFKDKIYDLGEWTITPFIETREDYMVYGDIERGGFFKRDFFAPTKEIKLCDIPEELSSLGTVRRLATHLTLTQDRKKAFLDTEILTPEGKSRYIQGLLNLEDGSWEEWGETEWICNHGQLNPKDDSMALCAWESAWEELGRKYQEQTGWYPRMWIVKKGEKTLIPARTMNFASHEIWDDDGKGLSWCGHGKMVDEDCVYHLDLESGEETAWAVIPGARHNSCSPDGKYVVVDQAPERWWRGGKWRVAFWNRETGKYVWIYSTRDPLMPQDNQSKLHPDPHPHFVMNGRYVISTANYSDGHMELYLTPVDQLIEMTR